jgi:MoaA/NifB/PqqE/SkfB family radical SAM enzyme
MLWMVPDICNLSCTYCVLGDEDHVASLKDHRSAVSRTPRRVAALARNAVRFGVEDALVLYDRQGLSDPHKMPPIDIPGLLGALEKTGKIFRITFTGGGEPFLLPNIVEAALALSEKHYVAFNTNLTSPHVKDLAAAIDPARMLVHGSLHIKELERKKLFRRYIENYQFCQQRGIEIYSIEVAHPNLTSEVEHYREMLGVEGIEFKFVPFKGEYEGRWYPAAYTEEEAKAFGLWERAAKGAQFNQKGSLCNAGYNVVVAGPDGIINPCYDIRENQGNMFGTIRLQPEVRRCPVDVCSCPLNFYDEALFKLALAERGKTVARAALPAAPGR